MSEDAKDDAFDRMDMKDWPEETLEPCNCVECKSGRETQRCGYRLKQRWGERLLMRINLIRAYRANGCSLKDLAANFNISLTTAHRLCKGVDVRRKITIQR